MAFLEPWLFGVPVAGRKIDYVTDDFAGRGLVLDRLYDRITVPCENGSADFPELSRDAQMDAVERVKYDRSFRDSLIKTNDFLERLFQKVPSGLIKENREKIMADYSVDSYGEKLYGIYKRMLEVVPGALPAAR